MTVLERRRLGSSELLVSELSLGSWRTYERIPREAGLAVMHTAREVGINFLDDARYNDETGHAPVKTGYSEMVFGELFRGAGWKRDEVVLANKLWWEFWPDQSAAQELEGSLGRIGIDYLDLAYAERPPSGLSVEQVVEDVTALIKAGKLRAWGVLNWPAALVAEAARIAGERGVAGPCAAQLPYSLAMRSAVEDPEMVAALRSSGASVVASYTLAGGALTGKYEDPKAGGRISARIDDRDYGKELAVGRQLKEFAEKHNGRPAAFAIAFTLMNPVVATVLFGATSPEQIEQNLGAVELKRSLDDATLAELRRVGAPA